MANANGWGDGSVNNNIGWGQGANNNIGWGKSHLNSWSGETDIDGGNLPSNSVAPAITGTAQEGQTLTCSTGTWSGSPSYTYQWKRNGNNITSATNSTYTLVTADVGQNILCTITATNFVGSATANSNTVTPTSSVDPDAQAFITAASITDPTQQSAINQLVVDLKGYGVWTKMKALYPFVGGTAAQHKWNLKDPRDLDAAFRLVFSGGWTHSVNGALPNGTNAYADTKLNDNSVMTLNNAHVSYYSRTQSNGTEIEIGVDNSLNILEIRTSGITYSRVHGGTLSQFNDSDSRAFYIGNRTASNLINTWRNGIKQNTNTTNQAGTKANANYYIGASNSASPLYSTKQCAFASIGNGLTDTEAANFYTAVQTFQVTLGRSIGTQTVSDADAQAFVTNAGIVDQVEANAINNLVIGLKADSLWTKMKAVYPMVGGSSSTMKYNLVNPLDTNAAFRLVFNGGWTFSSTGALPNGTNAYADTFFNQTTNFTSTSNASIGVYLRTNNASTGADMGAGDTGSSRQGMLIYSSFGGTYYGCAMGDTFISPAPTNADSRGFYSVVRNAGVQSLHKRGNITLNVSETEAVGTVTNETIWVGGGTSGGYNYSNRETAFNFIGDALSQSEIDNLYTRVTTFQTALNRNV